MNSPAIVLAALFALFASPTALAQQPAGAINQLSGMVVAVKPDGHRRILATASRVQVGDTLVSEADTYVRLVMDNGNEALLGPSTTLKVVRFGSQETALTLVNGQVHVSGALQQGEGHRYLVEAGGTTATVGTSGVLLSYTAAAADALAGLRSSWLRNSLAAAGPGTLTDGADELPLRQVVAQLNPAPKPPSAPAVLSPGLHVFVLDGSIVLSNAGGSMAFSAGQFGFVPNNITPPVLIPNPGLKFTPPPVFTITNQNTGSNNQPKPEAVDCEVR